MAFCRLPPHDAPAVGSDSPATSRPAMDDTLCLGSLLAANRFALVGNQNADEITFCRLVIS